MNFFFSCQLPFFTTQQGGNAGQHERRLAFGTNSRPSNRSISRNITKFSPTQRLILIEMEEEDPEHAGSLNCRFHCIIDKVQFQNIKMVMAKILSLLLCDWTSQWVMSQWLGIVFSAGLGTLVCLKVACSSSSTKGVTV